MRKLFSVIAIIITMLFIARADAGISDKLIFDFGGSISPIKMNGDWRYVPNENYPYLPKLQTNQRCTNMYSVFIEAFFKKNSRLWLGGGFSFMFNGNEIDSYVYRPRNYNPNEHFPKRPAKMYFLMPYVSAIYQFKLLEIPLYTQVSLGPGYGTLSAHANTGKREKLSAAGIGAVISLGKSIRFRHSMGMNIDAGYRYARTWKLSDFPNNLSAFYGNRVDLSGAFVQSSFSFGGR